jgi:hypothetical protein
MPNAPPSERCIRITALIAIQTKTSKTSRKPRSMGNTFVQSETQKDGANDPVLRLKRGHITSQVARRQPSGSALKDYDAVAAKLYQLRLQIVPALI